MKKGISRRTFLKGAATTAVGAAAFGIINGCSPEATTTTPADTTAATVADTTPAETMADTKDEFEVVGTYTTDVCIVGTGYSGLAAAVQALELGMSVIGLEQFGYPGGGCCGVEGIFCLNSKAQTNKGYYVPPSKFVKLEMDYSHNRANGIKWMEMANASGDNADWLISHGVNYPEIHEDKMFYSSDRVRADYTPAMYAEVLKMGGQVLLHTTGKKLLTNEDGAVCGVIAQKATGEYIQINAGAVILACGGYARNKEYLKEAGFWNADEVVSFIPNINGDSITLAREVGGDDILYKGAALMQPTVTGAPGGEYGTFGNGNPFVVASRSANNLWVNETGDRFCDENSGEENWMALLVPQLLHEKSYSIYDRAAFDKNFYGGPTAYERTTSWQYDDDKCIAQFENHFAENKAKDCVVADSIEELCKKAAAQFDKIDEQNLLKTITHYNELCAAGVDSDFGKKSEFMQEFKTGPFYMVYTPPSVMVTFGALANDREFRVVDKQRNPIAGLWVVGNDSCDLWPNIYTIHVQCGASANHIHGGRSAAKSIAKYITSPVGKITTEGDCTPCEVIYEYEMPAKLNDGTYTSDEFPGMFGWIKANVTVKDGKIAEVVGEHEQETAYIGAYAIRDMAKAMVAANNVNVDTVGGATASSCGFRMAVEDALAKAAK